MKSQYKLESIFNEMKIRHFDVILWDAAKAMHEGKFMVLNT